jgi:hypothetical protein
MTEQEDKKNDSPKSTSCKIIDQVKNPALRPLCVFWDEVRGDRLLPNASDIDPSQIANILKDIAILDVIDSENIRYRLAGTGIAERMGEDPTGNNLIEMTAPEMRLTVSEILLLIVSQPVGAMATYENIYSTGKRALVESLYLPLQKTEGQSDRIVSVHSREKTVTYEAEQSQSTVAAKILELKWLDIGAGVPDKTAS